MKNLMENENWKMIYGKSALGSFSKATRAISRTQLIQDSAGGFLCFTTKTRQNSRVGYYSLKRRQRDFGMPPGRNRIRQQC
jgi:hypothetical protein